MTQQPTYGPHNPHPLSQMRTELVWEGKYDEYGQRREVNIAGCAMPMQKIESIDEPRRAAAATGQLELFEQQNPRVDDFRNWLIWGDNKLVMASLLQEFKGKVDLIYIDPPFDVGADFSMKVQIGEEKEEIGKDQSILEMVAYRDMWGKGTDSYLHMMYDRFVLIRELLSETGSVYVHCDWRVIHLLKILLDDVFGVESYRNDTRWKRQPPRGAKAVSKQYARSSDSLLFYTKSDDYIWNSQYKSYDEKYIKSKFKPDSNGRFYRIDNIGDYSDKSIAEFRKQGKIYDYPYYATQKPEALLERIIQASSNEGDLVADFFCVRQGTRVWRVNSPPSPPYPGQQL